MILNSPGTLQFYETAEEQHRYKFYAYGQRVPITAYRNQVPPFQLIIPVDQANVNSAKIVSVATGVEVERFSNMVGLETVTKPTYKVVRYPATVLISGGLLDEGVYYLKLSNGVTTWYSEEFCMKADTGSYWKLQYCHSEDFELPGIGAIDYSSNFALYFLLPTEVGKPAYRFEETVRRRDGTNFFLQQIRFKTSRFELIVPEEVLDALSIVPLHDTITLSRGNRVYDIDELIMEVNWLEQGDLAVAEFEFKTDTVVVVNGRGVTDADCGPGEPGSGDLSCFDHVEGIPEPLEVLAMLVEGSTDHDLHQYTTPGGVVIPLEAGDLIVEQRLTGGFSVREFNGAGYIPATPAPGTYVFEGNTGTWYFQNGPASGDLMTNEITDISGTTVTYNAVPGVTVEFYALLASGGVILLAVETPSFAVDNVIELTLPDGTVAIKMICSTPSCPGMYEGLWLYFEPLATILCAGDFPNDTAASAGGVLPGEFYCLTIDNDYGMPAAVVKRLPPFTGYSTDLAAISAVGDNVIYQTAVDNDLGMPSGMVRIAVDGLDTYTTDGTAAAAGIAIGEFYIWNCLEAGFQPYLIKKREA